MANFDSGVADYIIGKATIEVGFPVDFKGQADISCNQCPYYRRSYRTCGLNGKVCAYPDRYVGDFCPLEIENKEE
jgi:hypothetical protein